jgi:hypothetical protein
MLAFAPMQTRARLLALPGYPADESVLHAAAELIDWLDQTIGPEAKR